MQGVGQRRKLRIHGSVFVGLVGLALLIAVIKLWGPAVMSRRQQEELARLRAQKIALQSERRELQDYKRRLASDEGQEGAARRDGYVREGDRRLVFVKEKEKKTPADSRSRE